MSKHSSVEKKKHLTVVTELERQRFVLVIMNKAVDFGLATVALFYLLDFVEKCAHEAITVLLKRLYSLSARVSSRYACSQIRCLSLFVFGAPWSSHQ